MHGGEGGGRRHALVLPPPCVTGRGGARRPPAPPPRHAHDRVRGVPWSLLHPCMPCADARSGVRPRVSVVGSSLAWRIPVAPLPPQAFC